MRFSYKFRGLLFSLLIICHSNAFSQSGAWSTKAPMPTARQVMGVGVVNGKVYAVGGTNSVTSSGTDFSVVEAYDPVSNTWSTKAPIPTARHTLGAGVVNEMLYAVGGHNGANVVSTVEAYDPESDSWTEVAPMPTARIPGVGVVNGVLYAVGGYDYSAHTALSTNEAFTPTSLAGVAQLSGGNTFTG